jgi:hypothetical protein
MSESDLWEQRHEHWLDRLHNHWIREHLREGQCFSRVRWFAPPGKRWDEWKGRFVPCEHDDARWFLISETVADRETMPTGEEFIEIIEIVETRTSGKLALYRQWMVDPDGTEVALSWVPKRSKVHMRIEHVLRAVLNRCEYDRCDPPERRR